MTTTARVTTTTARVGDDDSAAVGLPAGNQTCRLDSDRASGVCWDFS